MKMSKVSRLMNSIKLFQEKRKGVSCIAYNGDLHPVLNTQLLSIIKQCKKLDIEIK